MMTPEEVASMLSLDSETVYRHFRAGVIPAVKIGGQWRARRQDIEKLLIPKPAIVTLPLPTENDNG